MAIPLQLKYWLLKPAAKRAVARLAAAAGLTPLQFYTDPLLLIDQQTALSIEEASEGLGSGQALVSAAVLSEEQYASISAQANQLNVGSFVGMYYYQADILPTPVRQEAKTELLALDSWYAENITATGGGGANLSSPSTSFSGLGQQEQELFSSQTAKNFENAFETIASIF